MMQYNTQLVTLFGEIMNEISRNEIESVAQLENKLIKAEAGRDKEADSSIYCPLPKYVCVTVQK